MIDANQNEHDDPLKRRDSVSVTILIEGEENHTVIDNPPGFPSQEELEFMGVGGKTRYVEIDEPEVPDVQ